MKTYLLLTVLWLMAIFSPAMALEATLFDELQVLFPDTDTNDGKPKIETDTPYGTWAGINLLVAGADSKDKIKILLKENGKAFDDFKLYRMLEVYTPHNTGLHNKVEKKNTPQNPYVIRDAPFSVFDILGPCAAKLKASANADVMAFRIEIYVPKTTRKTKKIYSINIDTGKKSVKLEWTLNVYPVAIKTAGQSAFRYTNWFDTWKLGNNYPELVNDRKAFMALIENYNKMVIRSRQNTQYTYIPAEFKDGKLLFDHKKFDELIAWNRKYGYTTELSHLCHDKWGSPKLTLKITWKDIDDPGQMEVLEHLLVELNKAVKRNKLKGGLIHVRDEVVNAAASKYRKAADMVHKLVPDLRIIDAVNCNPEVLEGCIDEWVPLPQDYLRHQGFYQKRQKAGDHVWYYVCHNPGGKWINRMLDQERIRQVYLGWALVRYDLNGFLHWGFNYGNRQVAEDASYGGEFPPGDAHLVYPTPDGALSSHRLEAMRIGMEDADLLNALKNIDPQKSGKIIGYVFNSFNDYSTDISRYRKAKKELLEELSH